MRRTLAEQRGERYANEVTPPSWQEVVARVEHAARARGFDLAHPFAVDWYNRAVEPRARLGDFGRPRALAVLLANSRAFWPIFKLQAQRDLELAAAPHPLDAYVENSVAAISAELAPERALSYFSHVTVPQALPIQRLADLVGFAAIAPSHLAIHPLHGPWVSLRAVLVLDIAGPAGEPPELSRPCSTCSKPCMAAFEQALEVSGMPLEPRAIARHADAWIAVRDACPVGQASRFEQAQLDYHYRSDRSTLQGS